MQYQRQTNDASTGATANYKVVGTPYYMAPEVFTGKYNEKCDIWSMGVVLYQLMTGKYPFDGFNYKKVVEAIMYGYYEIPSVSRNLKDLIRKMLEKDPRNRISLNEILAHPWIISSAKDCQDNTDSPILDTEVVDNLKQFKSQCAFKSNVMNLLVKQVSPIQSKALIAKFKEADIDNNGFLSKEEFKQAISKAYPCKNSLQSISWAEVE